MKGIQIENLSYRYPGQSRNCLEDISCQFKPGSFWCIAGSNGSGKSTLLKLLAGILPTSSIVNSNLISHKKIGWIEGRFNPGIDITVEEFIVHGRYSNSTFWKPYQEEDKIKATEFINKLCLNEIRKKRISEISSGELQRCLLARTLLQEAEILLIDEGLAHLDLHYQIYFLSFFKQLQTTQGKTIILVHHDLNLSFEYCSNFLWLKNGFVIAQGLTEEITSVDILKSAFSKNLPIELGKNPFTGKIHSYINEKS